MALGGTRTSQEGVMGNQKIVSEINTALKIGLENIVYDFKALVQYPVP